MPHPQYEEVIEAFKHPEKYPESVVCVCDTVTNRAIEIFFLDRPIMIRVRIYPDLPPDHPRSENLKRLGFKIVEKKLRNPFRPDEYMVSRTITCNVRSLQRAAELAFLVVKEVFELPDDHKLYILPTDNPDEWSSDIPGAT